MLKPSSIELDGNGNYWYSTGDNTLVRGLKSALSYMPVSGTTAANSTTYNWIKFPNTKFIIIWFKHKANTSSGSSISAYSTDIPTSIATISQNQSISISAQIAGTVQTRIGYTEVNGNSLQYYLIDQSGGTSSRSTTAYITVYGKYS